MDYLFTQDHLTDVLNRSDYDEIMNVYCILSVFRNNLRQQLVNYFDTSFRTVIEEYDSEYILNALIRDGNVVEIDKLLLRKYWRRIAGQYVLEDCNMAVKISVLLRVNLTDGVQIFKSLLRKSMSYNWYTSTIGFVAAELNRIGDGKLITNLTKTLDMNLKLRLYNDLDPKLQVYVD